mgnify:CR=1 FL=1
MLSGLFVVRRCYMTWAQALVMQADRALGGIAASAHWLVQQPHPAEVVLPPVQQWLQSSSTQEQLVAAGYAPQALPQQLQQVAVTLQAIRDSAARRAT